MKQWSDNYKPEDVRIYDHFILSDGSRIIIQEIRKIKRHGVYGDIWEFIDRDSNRMVQFHELKTQIVED